MAINKEKENNTRITVRLPIKEYEHIKSISDSTRGGKKGTFISMNDLIIDAIRKKYIY